MMMLYRNLNVKVRSADGDAAFFDIVAGVFQVDMVAVYLFILCLYYSLQMPIDLIEADGFTLKNARSRWYLTENITDANSTDNQALLINTPAQTESLFHCLEQAGICINMNANKMVQHYSFILKLLLKKSIQVTWLCCRADIYSV